MARSSDEVHPRHLSPEERADFEAADAAEWRAIVDSGSLKVLNSITADVVRRERPDQVINSRMAMTRQASGGHLSETKSLVQVVCIGASRP